MTCLYLKRINNFFEKGRLVSLSRFLWMRIENYKTDIGPSKKAHGVRA
jgi:hypothetical protein